MPKFETVIQHSFLSAELKEKYGELLKEWIEEFEENEELKKLEDTKALRQKILDLAIHGKLIPPTPNDEPVSVLLERIKVEKNDR